MLDEWHLPDNSRAVQQFNYTGTWQTWTKPRGITMIHILAIGGGGGGGNGYTGVTSTIRGGGSGGSAGGQIMVLGVASLLPDLLYVNVGAGSAGAASGASEAANGGETYVSFYPSSVYVWIAAAGGDGGDPGTSSGGGAGPPGASASVAGPPLMMSTAVSSSSNAGAVGGTNGTLGVISFNSQISMPGNGGGGAFSTNADQAGGSIASYLPFLAANVSGGTTPGGAGSNGFAIAKPMLFLGGAGGGSYAAGTGGAGGNGATGCGGGGGGGGLTGGAGGNGGNGLVVITCW
jgi:hypothetical protein